MTETQRFRDWIDQYESAVRPWAEGLMSDQDTDDYWQWCQDNLDHVLFGYYFAAKKALS